MTRAVMLNNWRGKTDAQRDTTEAEEWREEGEGKGERGGGGGGGGEGEEWLMERE